MGCELKRILLALLLVCSAVSAAEPKYANETTWIKRLADKYKAKSEVVLADHSRADLVSDTVAYEVEWAYKWKESIGQCELYSILSNRKPGVILLVRDRDEEQRHILRCAAVCAKLGIELCIEDVPPEPEITP